MKITKKKLEYAVAEEIISHEQADKLFTFLKAQPSNANCGNSHWPWDYLFGPALAKK